MSEHHSRLLIIVAYRDNEVDEQHPAMLTLRQIEGAFDTKTVLDRMVLQPLAFHEVATLLDDALHCKTTELQALVALVHGKTAGNPFFIGEFLKTLYTDNLLNFDLDLQRWCWDIADIERKDITDNVIDLMLGKMARLPEDAQALIQLASCVGSRFSLDMLAQIAEQPLNHVTHQLWPALRDGLLLQDGGDWHLGLVQTPSSQTRQPNDELALSLSMSSPVSPHCRFLHDRMLQAAYQSMNQRLREQTHLRVGRLMLQQRPIDTLSDEDCFAITEQLNNARALIDQASECETLMQLNLRAAKQAKAASVWEAASGYAQQGITLLAENAWLNHAQASRALYQIAAECLYLQGLPEQAEPYYQALLQYSQDPVAKAEICAARLVQCIGKGDYLESIGYGQQALMYLGIPMPEREADLALETLKAQRYIRDHAGDVATAVAALPETTDEALKIALGVYPNLSSVYLVVNQLPACDYCAVLGTASLFRGGQSDLSVLQLASYAVYLQRKGEHLSAYDFASAAVALSRQRPSLQVANAYNLIGLLVWYNQSPLQACAELQMEGYERGQEQGELGRSLISYCSSMITETAMGVPLLQLYEKSKVVRDLLTRKAVFHPGGTIFYAYAHALLYGGDKAAEGLDDEQLPPTVSQAIKNSVHHWAYFTHFRALLAFWGGHHDKALAECRALEAHEHSLQTVVLEVDQPFLYALLLLKQPRLSKPERAKLKDLRGMVETYANLNPNMFAHKRLLLDALFIQREHGGFEQVCSLFKQAIESARQAGFHPYYALACELFADYWQEQGYDDVARTYWQQALQAYQYWGGSPRIQKMQRNLESMPVESGTYLKTMKTASHSHTQSSTSAAALDMVALMKSAQLISGELDIGRLPGRVLHVIMESVGASKSALVVNIQGTPQVVALLDEGQEQTTYDPPRLLESQDDLPQSIVRFVLNREIQVSIGDIRTIHEFSRDRYLQQHSPRSVLCMPVNYRDRTYGALYLENRYTPHAFNNERLDAIRLLLAQASIAFENARLFQEVTELNQGLERRVRLRTSELKQANKALRQANDELKSFGFSVSHDLRAPLRSITGFSRVLRADYLDRLGDEGAELVDRIVRNSAKMQDLIEGLLALSRVQRQELEIETVDLSALVGRIASDLQQQDPDRPVYLRVAAGCSVQGDPRMLQSLMQNLLANAWKYTGKTPDPQVEFGAWHPGQSGAPDKMGDLPKGVAMDETVYYLRDNGAGFDMASADKLFGTFSRLHTDTEFPGTGVGLATVKRIVQRHGGEIWAYAEPGKGATFYFTLPDDEG